MTNDYYFSIGELNNGGQERQLFYLLAELSRQGKSIHLFVWNYSPGQKYTLLIQALPGSKIYYNSGNRLKKLIAFRSFITSLHPPLIQNYSFYTNFYVWLCTLGTATVGVGAIRSRLDRSIRITGILSGYLCAIFPKHKISNNFLYHIYCSRWIKFFNRKTRIVTNHLDIRDFRLSTPAHDGILRTASVGRLFQEKRIDLLIEVLARLKEKGIPFMHEHAGDGILKDDLIRLAGVLNVSGQISFVGEKSNISDFLENKHLFLHTSDYEGYPNVIMEAMACGKPVVTTNCGDVSMITRDNRTGYILPIGDVDGLVEKILYLNENPELIKRFGLRARRIAETKFNLSHFAEKTLSTCLSMLKK